MLWTLRFCRHSQWQRRAFSFTPNYRLPRSIGGHGTRFSHTPRSSIGGDTARSSEAPSFREAVRTPTIRNQILFFVFGSFVAFGVAARQTNLDTYYWTNKMSESGFTWRLRDPSNDELRKARQHDLGTKLAGGLVKLHTWMAGLPQDIRAMISYSYTQIANSVLTAPEGQRMCYAIGAINGLVWLAWQFPRLTPFMMMRFSHHPLSGMSSTLLTSVFSHSGVMHVLFNTLALSSFGVSACHYLTQTQQDDPTRLRESTSIWHFLAFYISAGMCASLVSHVVAARLTYPRLVSRLLSSTSSSSSAASAASAATQSTIVNGAKEITSVIRPSLGASGAIYATFALTAMAYPDAQVSLIFPPTPPIAIQHGFFGLMAVDVLGILRGWRVLDHHAHLGGALFGLWYYAYGTQIWESFREMTLGGLPPSLRKQ